MRKALVIPLIALLSLAADCAAASAASSSLAAGPITVGVIAPFSGPAAEFGTLLSAPCIAATDLINKSGGVLGHKLQCTSVDDTGDPADAVPNVTRALATISNFDMAEGLETNTAATTIPLVNGAHIPFVTAAGLTGYDKTKDKYFWRLTPADDANGAAMIAYAKQKGYKKVAVVFEDNSTDTGNVPGINKAAPKEGVKLAVNTTIPADATSYSSLVATLIADHPQALVFDADPQTTATFLSNYSQLNNGKLPTLITATDSLTPDWYSAVAKAVGQSYIFHHVALVGSYFSQSTPAFTVYKNALLADSKTHGIANTLSSVGPPASIYDGLNILALAMVMAKSARGSVYNSDVTKVAKHQAGAEVVDSFAAGERALAKGKKIQYVGVLGAVTFNKYHNFAGAFAADVFTGKSTSRRSTLISASEVSKLLG
ncbi:MAG TPA: ABC transporter substrate-binding protein [Candidatus Dormibacteraeota bacterium]|nr:ABC transporter substrate-binding protein [Candidatus Dormibacteraeota bacterium]